jgi:integrase
VPTVPKAANPYQEGNGWSMRRRVKGVELYVSGHPSATAARKEMADQVGVMTSGGKPKGLGPYRTSVAQALQDYAIERLPFMKGASQDANRINKVLRAARLATLKVTRWDAAVTQGLVQPDGHREDRKGRGQHYVVELVEPEPSRRIPNGLGAHRKKLAEETTRSDALRRRIACMPMADVQRHHLQDFIDALRAEGREPATLQLEQALYRGFFNYAARIWNWAAPAENPATHLVMPTVDNGRERVMSAAEEARLDEALESCRNAVAAQVVVLLTETGMRASEPLLYATWGAVDWERKVLRLSDAKAGRRDVPLSPRALEVLRTLRADVEREPQARIIELTYESLKAAWTRALERAGLENLRLQDLRHTAATRLALRTGNVLLVKALTGHKTMAMVDRYMNVKADDVVAVLHAPAPAAVAPAQPDSTTPANPTAASTTEDACAAREALPQNVVRVAFGRKRAAG